MSRGNLHQFLTGAADGDAVPKDDIMVTKSNSMYPYMHNNGSTNGSSKSQESIEMMPGCYWNNGASKDATPNRDDYAHHLRSSSYQLLHSQHQLNQGAGAFHHVKQQSGASSNY